MMVSARSSESLTMCGWIILITAGHSPSWPVALGQVGDSRGALAQLVLEAVRNAGLQGAFQHLSQKDVAHLEALPHPPTLRLPQTRTFAARLFAEPCSLAQ